jgi:hypothetical protein
MKMPVFHTITLILAIFVSQGCKKELSTESGQPLQSSEWLKPGENAPEWQNKNVDGIGPAQVLEIADPAITQELINSSVVLVYGNLGGYPAQIRQPGKIELMRLLVSYMRGNNPRTDVWSGMPIPGKMLILLTNPDNEYDPYGNAKGHEFRYFFVPKYNPDAVGKKPAEGSSNLLAKYTEADLRNMSYEQFIAAAGLKK